MARLPPDTGEEEFSLLVSSYGLVGESFLVASEVTGAGKGYGLVRYKCSQAAAQARHLLDNKTVRGFSVQVRPRTMQLPSIAQANICIICMNIN